MIKKIMSILLAVATAACSTQEKAGMQQTEPMQQESAYSFATNMFGAVNKATDEENFCISPAGALWALSMPANGAAGTTADEMYATMGNPAATENRSGYNSLQRSNIDAMRKSKSTIVKIANSIWANNKIKVKEEFKAVNSAFYQAAVKSVPFNKATENDINNWCSEQTDGKINSIVKELPPSTQMVLVNAIYFKAGWADPFKKEDTKKATFTKSNGKTMKVDMMQQTRRALYHEDDFMQATEKPFIGKEYSMLLILPREGVTFESIAERLAQGHESALDKWEECMLTLSMPKFKSEFGTSLKPMLADMGIKDAFTENADFSGISKTPLLIDDVLQKTYIAVDEEGAEAAAVTAVQMAMMSAFRPVEKKEMTLNRPFIYAIKDNRNGEILFMGKMGNPNKQ